MDREFKISRGFVKGIEGRTVIGFAAIIGNVDEGGDRILPGAFTKTLAESLRRVRHLWQHGCDGWVSGNMPPIAAIRGIREVGRAALTAEVLEVAPDAMGALEVEREYLQTERGNEILACYQSSIPLEMSIAYSPIKRITYFEEGAIGKVSEDHLRDLVEIRLFDTSDVNWGMNSATVGSKAAFELGLKSINERLEYLHEQLAKAPADSAALIEFYRLVELFKNERLTNDVDGPILATNLAVPSQSRAEPGNRISLTQAKRRLREMELALVS